MEQADSKKSLKTGIAYKIIGIVGLYIALGLLYYSDVFIAFMFVFAMFIFVAIPSLVLSVICQWLLKHRPTWRFLAIGPECRIIAISIILCLPAIPILMVITDYRLDATKRHCEKLIPRLEEWRQQNGRYPTSLIEIGEIIPSQWFLEFSYGPSEDRFTFSMSDPSAIFDFWIYDSDEHQWFKED